MSKGLFDIDLYKKHFAIALKAHQTQQTPSGLPYSYHIVNVTNEIIVSLEFEKLSYEQANESIASALLHDVIEDTEYDLSKEQLNPLVLEGVKALSKDFTLPKEVRMEDSIKRIQKLPLHIQMVKIADRITNLDPPPKHWDKVRIKKYKEESIYIANNLQSPSMYLHQKLLQKIENYKRYT